VTEPAHDSDTIREFLAGLDPQLPEWARIHWTESART
jgi:hypothetical protein